TDVPELVTNKMGVASFELTDLGTFQQNAYPPATGTPGGPPSSAPQPEEAPGTPPPPAAGQPFPQQTPGVLLQATDPRALNVKRRLGNELLVGAVSQDFLIRTDKAVYDGGDTIALTIFSASSQPIFLDWIKDGQSILTEKIQLVGNPTVHQLDLKPEMSGTL